MSEVHADSNERPRCVVMKFGGTSVEDAAAIRRLCQIVNGCLRYHPVVVVSALAKVTDQLFGAGNAAARLITKTRVPFCKRSRDGIQCFPESFSRQRRAMPSARI